MLFRRTDQSANNENNNFSQSYSTEILPDLYEPTYTILSTSHNYEKPNLCTYIPTRINEDPYNTTDENHLQVLSKHHSGYDMSQNTGNINR